MKRHNRYERVFEAYLRRRGACYLAVDETRRALVNLKSPDFIVTAPERGVFLVDVKGRRYPSGTADRPRYVWENWSTLDDLHGLSTWQANFGSDATAVLAFVYELADSVELPTDAPDCSEYRGRRYLIRGVTIDDYRQACRCRSPRWGTVSLPRDEFAAIVWPFSELIGLAEFSELEAELPP